MQRSEVSGAVRPIYGSLGVKRLIMKTTQNSKFHINMYGTQTFASFIKRTLDITHIQGVYTNK